MNTNEQNENQQVDAFVSPNDLNDSQRHILKTIKAKIKKEDETKIKNVKPSPNNEQIEYKPETELSAEEKLKIKRQLSSFMNV